MNNELTQTTENLLQEFDNFEESLNLLEILNKKYDELKKQLKSEMVKIGKENNLEQIKWTTPKGHKITCSIGKEAIYETKETKEFDIEKLKKEYFEIYEKCLVEKETKTLVQSGSNDTLRITLNKGEK